MSRASSPGSGKPYGLAPGVPGLAGGALHHLPAPHAAPRDAAAASRAGRADAGCGAGRGDPGRARRQPLPRRGLPQGLGQAAARRRPHLQAARAAADGRTRPARPLAGRPAPWPAQPRWHHHPGNGGRDAGHRPGHHRHRRGPGGGVHRHRPLQRRLRRHPRCPPRHPLRGAGAQPSASAAVPRTRQGVRRCFGGFAEDIACGLAIRHDHGSQYMAYAFQKELRFLGIESSPAFVRAPEGNGCTAVGAVLRPSAP